MAPDEPSGARPAGPVVLRIKLRYDDVEAMIARFAVNVGKTGLFLPTKSIQPVGTEIKFELRIATDQPVLIGLGRVKASRAPDPDDPGTAYGMAVELMRVTRESRELILKMLERRKQLGLLEIGLPMPADIDAARRAEVMESGVREATSGAVPQLVTPVLESAPVLTAPRRTTGPIALQKVATIEPLAPEAPRKKRVPIADLIASASGPIAAPAPIDGLDDNIDVAAALARARMLAAGTDLDGELEALRDAAAAPLVEIGIEAASAELARQLGGSAVSKSARWARPPQIAEPVSPEPPATEIDGRDVEAKAPTDIEPENRSHQSPPTDIEGRRDGDVEAKAPTDIDGRGDRVDVEAKAPTGIEAESRAHQFAPTDIDGRGDRVDVEAKAPTDIDRQGGRAVDAKNESVSNNEQVAARTEPEPKRRRFGARFDRQVEAKAERVVEAKAERVVEAKAERVVEAKAERVVEAKVGRASVDGVPVPVAPEPVAEVLAPTPEQIEAPAAETRADIDRPDIGRADVDRADIDRADIGRAGIDHDDIERDDARRVGLGRADVRAAIEPPVADEAATPVGAAPMHAPAEDEDEPALFADRQPAFANADPMPMIHDGADPMDFEEAHEVEPEQIADEINRLSDNDIEEMENTQIGETPSVDEDAFANHAYATVPSEDAIADRLDQQLDEAEREDMGFDGSMQRYSDEPSPFDPSLEAALVAAASAEAVGNGDEIEEIEDFEIIAEADEADADLMNADAEHDVHARPLTPSPEDAPSRPSFLNRLSLDDESGTHAPAPARFDDEFAHEPGPVDPRVLSAGYALSAFETSTPDPEGGYEEFDAPHNNYAGGIQLYVPQDAFDQSDVIAVPPERAVRSPAQRKQDDEDFPDLESALEALDVDLDDIGDPSKAAGMPRAVTGGQRRRSASMVSHPTEDARVANVRGRVHKRATTEDGIVIDFDDEDE